MNYFSDELLKMDKKILKSYSNININNLNFVEFQKLNYIEQIKLNNFYIIQQFHLIMNIIVKKDIINFDLVLIFLHILKNM